MIGVVVDDRQRGAAREFFELFKTPWDFYQAGRKYDVLLCGVEPPDHEGAALTVVYGASKRRVDSRLAIECRHRSGTVELDSRNGCFPVYRGAALLNGQEGAFLWARGSREPCGLKVDGAGGPVARIGYDLLEEVAFLLGDGQPAGYATVPTLEMHISVLRDLMMEAGVAFVEIPPVPHGYDFIACLTHDIDFAGIRNHKLDHTMLGFLYRAVWQTSWDALRGKTGWKKVRRNLRAVVLLPAVYLGILRDFWVQFDHYLEVEQGLRSTFFFLPFPGTPGTGMAGPAPGRRAGKYHPGDLRDPVRRILSKGCEIGLHGIDAWRDADKGRREAEEIASVAGCPVRGVRSHWLYFDEESPRVLEQAGLQYDSSYGYNDAAGFRAGTAQAFRPPAAGKMLELPLTIQDTAMFYPSRMNLGEDEAFALCKEIMDKLSVFGGALVINWHDRSLAPERLWDDAYERLLNELKSRKVWFATCSEAAGWYEKRRRAGFRRAESNGDGWKVTLEGQGDPGTPDLKVVFCAPSRGGGRSAGVEVKCVEMAVKGDGEMEIPLTVE